MNNFIRTGNSTTKNLNAFFTAVDNLPGRDIKTILGFNKMSWGEKIARDALGRIPERLHKHIEVTGVRNEFIAVLQNIVLVCEGENAEELRKNLNIVNTFLTVIGREKTTEE